MWEHFLFSNIENVAWLPDIIFGESHPQAGAVRRFLAKNAYGLSQRITSANRFRFSGLTLAGAVDYISVIFAGRAGAAG